MNNSLMLALIVDTIEGIIGGFLYNLCAIIFQILDIVQSLFRTMVGLESFGLSSDPTKNYDLIFELIQTDIVYDTFMSMVLCGLILLFLCTGLAIIRNLYQDKQKPVSEFIKLAFKGLSGYLFVPITVMLGLAFSNVILIVIDGATNQGKSYKVSGTLFVSASYNANSLRSGEYIDGGDPRKLALGELMLWTNFEDYPGVKKIIGDVGYFDVLSLQLTDQQWDRLADLLDEATINGEWGLIFRLALLLYGFLAEDDSERYPGLAGNPGYNADVPVLVNLAGLYAGTRQFQKARDLYSAAAGLAESDGDRQ